MAGKLRKILSPSAAACPADSIHHKEKGSEEKHTGAGNGCISLESICKHVLGSHSRGIFPSLLRPQENIVQRK